MAANRRRTKLATVTKPVEDYKHTAATGARVPDAGAQSFIKSQHAPGKYRFDSSLSPLLEWDEANPAREEAEAHIAQILAAGTLDEAKAAAEKLKAMSRPFLNWAGKAERPNLEVPTLPLFVHERLSTKLIVETLKGHRRNHRPGLFDDLVNDSGLSLGEQAMQAYEHGPWSNRMILGDNLQVMNWLLRGENLGGQVQMIYLDPPYGIKYGSNFQPFVRKRDVSHNEDDDLTREPETVQAYRDTWQVGLHSYLTCLRDRLTIARDLLHPSGSIFVQIGDENVHLVRSLLDEVFGSGNFCAAITYKKTTTASTDRLAGVSDSLIWYAKDSAQLKYRQLYRDKQIGADGGSQYTWAEHPDGTRKNYNNFENLKAAPKGSRLFTHDNITSQRPLQGSDLQAFVFEGHTYRPGKGTFKTDLNGLNKLAAARRLLGMGETLRYLRFLDDFPVYPLVNLWDDTVTSGFADKKVYVVQTNPLAVQRCILMTTDPGDLVLDPTCGSGTTAYVAEQWGRRWITTDVSRVPLALARQRLLTATFNWYELKDEDRGPVGGFVYKRKQNRKGDEVGGIVPHVTLKSIVNGEPPAEEVLVDRPEVSEKIIRVTGPFTFEASIPQALDESAEPATASGGFAARLLDALRRSPRLHFEGNQTVEVRNVRPPAKSMHLSAEGEVQNGKVTSVAFLFGPENGPVSDKQVVNALTEARMKGFARLFVIGLNIHPGARMTIENAADMGLPPATYLQATPDLLMGDLLKNMKSSQLFSVCGLPDVVVRPATPKATNGKAKEKGNGKNAAAPASDSWQVELLGLDVFDPVSMLPTHRSGNDVPAWFLDTDYNDKCFHVCQAFFPRTSAWDNLKKELKAGYDEGVWDHLAGTTSAPFEAGGHRQVAVKVIDDRGNELMVVKPLDGGK